MVRRTFLTRICINAKYFVQMIENDKTMVELVVVTSTLIRRMREKECMLKLRTMYLYRLNRKLDVYEDDKNVKRFKSDDIIVGELFPSLPRLFQRDKACRHDSWQGMSILNYKQFIINLNNYLKDDLPNPLN